MACPSCGGDFKKYQLDEYLLGESCIKCNGVSFSLSDYLYYLSRSSAVNEDLDKSQNIEMDEDTKTALRCNCGQLMSKYKISHESDRRVDNCSACQTIWLDNGEWQYLRSNNLHRVINKIFTDPYQRNIRLQNTKNVLHKNYNQLLGEEDYTHIKDVRCWIENNPNKSVLKAYLNAQNPYSVEK